MDVARLSLPASCPPPVKPDAYMAVLEGRGPVEAPAQANALAGGQPQQETALRGHVTAVRARAGTSAAWIGQTGGATDYGGAACSWIFPPSDYNLLTMMLF